MAGARYGPGPSRRRQAAAAGARQRRVRPRRPWGLGGWSLAPRHVLGLSLVLALVAAGLRVVPEAAWHPWTEQARELTVKSVARRNVLAYDRLAVLDSHAGLAQRGTAQRLVQPNCGTP